MLTALRQRAQLLAKIRDFFNQHGVLEVETPLLSHSSITDPNLHSFMTQYGMSRKQSDILYLQTSPEFAMKRLLALGCGSIYQICKAFRNNEYGHQHNPEFTILEWYQVGFDHHKLMNEMDEFLHFILDSAPAEKLSYHQVFEKYLKLNPHTSSINELQKCALKNGLNNISELDRDGWLNILLTHFIEPYLGNNRPTFIYDFPASQAALAMISQSSPGVAERFEVYINGIEIANGFHELTDAKEQRQRFLTDLQKRRELNLPEIPIDENFLIALDGNFPNCAGVAVGVDRLLMLLMGTKSIRDVISFPIDCI
jgi:lysyl-tRNA synthetase class 2